MEIIYTNTAQKDIKYWIKKNDALTMQRISDLLFDITLHPFEGVGNPEALKHELSGCWSRRINKEHRLVYRLIDDETVEVYSLRFHY